MSTSVQIAPIRQSSPNDVLRAIDYFVRSRFEQNSFLCTNKHFTTSKKQIALNSTWLRIVLFNFLVAATMGLILRLAWVDGFEMPFLDFRNMMHAHSHTAMLGWLFMVIYAIALDSFLKQEAQRPVYAILFWLSQLSVLGMMFSFPVQGYGAVSITFTTIHLLISYAVAFVVLRRIPRDGSPSTILMQSALVLMVLSTAGVWLLGPIQARLFGDDVLYHMSIQFFLHFQFNGWFTFAVLAFVFKQIENKGAVVPKKQFWVFYGLLIVSSLLTYALAVTWTNPENWLFWINGAGVVIQLGALVAFWAILQKNLGVFKSASKMVRTLYMVALISFALKIIIQTVVVIPEIAKISYTIRNFVIGFIHLTMLGSISCYLLGLLLERNYLSKTSKMMHWGLISLILGFVLTEGFLSLQGLALWMRMGFWEYYYEGIFAVSVFLPLGIALMLAAQFNRHARNNLTTTKIDLNENY